METVSDDEAFRAMHVMAKMEGMAFEPAAAVAFAGVIKMVRSGAIAPDDVVVINATGHTIPVEREVLGDGWAKVLSGDAAHPLYPTPQPKAEGLMAALERLDERVRSIAIVEDNADSATLLRRILQARGNYTIFEARNGVEGLAMIREHRPDLVMLDLMMPEMDGFQVLDHLKADAATAKIPVIVVTAKALTRADKERLGDKVDGLMQKGSFMDDDLFSEITEALTK